MAENPFVKVDDELVNELVLFAFMSYVGGPLLAILYLIMFGQVWNKI